MLALGFAPKTRAVLVQINRANGSLVMTKQPFTGRMHSNALADVTLLMQCADDVMSAVGVSRTCFYVETLELEIG